MKSHQVEEDLNNEIYGAPIFDVYDDEEPPRTATLKNECRSIQCEEVYERMDKGLCVICDELDTPNHYKLKHKGMQLLVGGCGEGQVVEDGVTMKKPIQPAKGKMKKLIQPAKGEMKKQAQDVQDRAATWRKKMKEMKKRKLPVKVEITRLATSPPKSRQARKLPTRCRKPGRRGGSKSSKHKPGVGFTQPRKQRTHPRSPFLRRRLQVSCLVIPSWVEEVLSLAGRMGFNGKRPFDRGKVMLVRRCGCVSNLEDKVL